jgi:hypothetical protein
LLRWDGTPNQATGQLVAELSPLFWEDPQLLHDDPADEPLHRVIDAALGLQFPGSYIENWGGAGEKWLLGANNQWYFIKPGGELRRWDGSPSATGTLIAHLAPIFWLRPALLHDAAGSS